jgi:hypothetical protein
MTALIILITQIILRFIIKEYTKWFYENTKKIGVIFVICAFIDLYIIYILFINCLLY